MPADGSDYALDSWGAYQDVNELKDAFAGASAPSDPATGVLYFYTTDKKLKIYNGSGWLTFGIAGGMYPEGTIIAWIGGYFTDGSNGGYTYVLGSANTVAGANAYLNSLGWYVCNGAALNDGDSTIFDGAGRYLPNLTDDRFLMGDTAAGSTGGSSTMAHTHDLDIGAFDSGASDDNVDAWDYGTDVPHPSHTHSIDPPNTTSGAASNTENRPLYLSCFYIMRVK